MFPVGADKLPAKVAAPVVPCSVKVATLLALVATIPTGDILISPETPAA